MNPESNEHTEALIPGQEAPTEQEPPEVPFLFGISLAIPLFAVIVYIVLRLLNHDELHPRPEAHEEEEKEEEEKEKTPEAS